MTEDTEETTTEEQTEEGEALAFSEMMDFATDRVAEEADSVDAEIPNHAARLIAARATDLLETLTNIEMAEAMEAEDEDASVSEDDVKGAIEEDAVDILLAVGALQYEHDLDIATAFEERMAFIEDYKEFQEAMDDVESQEEAIEVMDEHMTEELAAEMGMPMMGDEGGNPLAGGPSIEPGDSVDAEDYEHDEKDKSFA